MSKYFDSLLFLVDNFYFVGFFYVVGSFRAVCITKSLNMDGPRRSKYNILKKKIEIF